MAVNTGGVGILEKALSLLGSGPWKFLTAAVVGITAIASASPGTASQAYIVIAVAILVAAVIAAVTAD
ncbi:hypothetical protein [Haloarcula amylovorans]|uniref:hypothetical protein n=1 Tax=Haloarcula amylovorans TaxID=2562280 RepID=UPI0010760003|nr:hypothetical protein [Halomicroarcula amylolytica]